MKIRDPECGMEQIRIPDPQHCLHQKNDLTSHIFFVVLSLWSHVGRRRRSKQKSNRRSCKSSRYCNSAHLNPYRSKVMTFILVFCIRNFACSPLPSYLVGAYFPIPLTLNISFCRFLLSPFGREDISLGVTAKLWIFRVLGSWYNHLLVSKFFCLCSTAAWFSKRKKRQKHTLIWT